MFLPLSLAPHRVRNLLRADRSSHVGRRTRSRRGRAIPLASSVVALALSANLADVQRAAAATTTTTTTTPTTTTAITYEANGGQFAGAATSMIVQEVLATNADTQAPAVTLSGDTLLGWSTSATATVPDASDTVSATALTLYAVWAKNYNVIYNGNGGTPLQTTQSEAVGSDPVFQGPASIPTYASNTFLGWSANKNAQSGDAMGADKVPVGGLVMYAVWRLPTDIQILFFENNSQLDSHTSWQQSALVNAPSPATMHLENTMGFSNPGYRFVEWCTVQVRNNQPCTGTIYTDGELYSFAQNLNLYAVWTNIPLESVTYSANGGTSANVVQTEQEGSNPVTLAPTAPPTRPGFTFAGWALNAGAAAPLTAAQVQVLAVPAAAETLYAVWTPLSYPVHYVAASTSSAINVAEVLGSDPIVQAPASAPSRAGYTFLGWNAAANDTSGASTGQLNVPQSGMTLFAIWRKDAKRPTIARALSVVATHDALTIRWKAPASDGGAPLTHYTVTVNTAHDARGIVCSAPDQLTTVAYCPNLRAGTPYQVTVSASNVIGTGPLAHAARAVAPLGALAPHVAGVTRASAPLDVRAHFTNAVALVQWHAPVHLGGAPVIVYDVTVPGTTVQCFTPSTICSLVGLRSNVAYTFLVSAITVAGRGDQGTAISAYHEATVTLEVVPFEFNSAVITPGLSTQVDNIASFMARHHIAAATIVGHTDLVGSNAYDQALGELRSSDVASALLARLRAIGVLRAPVLATVSRGKADPVLANYRQTHGGSSRRVTVTMSYFF